MNLKTLSIAISTSLMLIACGGGSSSNNDVRNDNNANAPTDNNSSQNNQITRWSSFLLDYTHQNYINTGLDLINNEFNIVNGKLYGVMEDYDDQEVYLTTNGEYLGIGPIHSQYGALLGDITVSNDQFAIRPYSKIGSSGLIFTQNNKRIDLTGKPVLVTVSPDINWDAHYPEYSNNKIDAALLSKLKDYQKLTFPKGSVCLQQSKYTNNQAYLTLFQSSTDNKLRFENITTDYLNNVDTNYLKFTQYFNSIAYLYSYDKSQENAQGGVALYDGQYLSAYLERQGVEYDLSATIQEIKDAANDPDNTAEDKAAYLSYADDLSQGCDLYNDVAIQFLKQNIK